MTRHPVAARRTTTLGALSVLTLFAAAPLAAQDGAPRGGIRLAPVLQTWTFSTPLEQDSLRVSNVSQFSLPVSVVVPLGANWTFDASGAYTRGRVKYARDASSGRAAGELALDGATDVKMRLVGRVAGDRVQLTLGVNAPSGSTRLAGDQVAAIRVIGAPALRMPSPVLGSGFGATAGVVVAAQAGEWALAFGGSYEVRGTYSPIEASIAGVRAPTDLDPADAMHVTFGADRLIGAHRVSFVLSGDIFGEDKISIAAGGSTPIDGTYKLGPGMTTMAIVDLGVAGFRELGFSLADRYRGSFRGLDGQTAPGSSGNYLDLRGRAVIGAVRRAGLVLGFDARFDSGLEVDNTIATAAVTAAGITLGVSLPAGGYALEPFARAQFGTLDTGVTSTSIKGFGFGVSLMRR